MVQNIKKFQKVKIISLKNSFFDLNENVSNKVALNHLNKEFIVSNVINDRIWYNDLESNTICLKNSKYYWHPADLKVIKN